MPLSCISTLKAMEIRKEQIELLSHETAENFVGSHSFHELH
jgi:hypothetical protein